MKLKTVRYLAGAAFVPLVFEVLPHGLAPENDCVADVSINVCSASEDPWAIEPRTYHTPHQDFETQVGAGYGWIASGQAVASTSAGPSHRITLAGDSVARLFDW